MIRNWINLTNGLQAISEYGLTEYSVMRLQSTHCEQKRWEDVLASVPDEFLFRVALGDECVVFDYGARKAVPRAIWQGLEWVKYVLSRRWFDADYAPQGRARTAGMYFAEQFSAMGKRTKVRLDYFKPMVSGTIRIRSVTGSTERDGNKQWMIGCIANKGQGSRDL